MELLYGVRLIGLASIVCIQTNVGNATFTPKPTQRRGTRTLVPKLGSYFNCTIKIFKKFYFTK